MINSPTTQFVAIRVIAKHLLPIRMIAIALLLGSFSQPAIGQTEIRLAQHEIRCFAETVKLKHIARISSGNARIASEIEELDIDQFATGQSSIVVSKEQIRIRLALSGIDESRIRVSGPESLTVVAAKPKSQRELVARVISERIAGRFHIPVDDIQVIIDSKFQLDDSSGLDVATLRLEHDITNEIPLGRQTIGVSAVDTKGQGHSMRIPVSIAVIRDLVVANKNISKGQLFSPTDVESVRRPVMRRNVRFASFEQVVGTEAQSDIQQYEIIKSNVIRKPRAVSSFAVKRNSHVTITARRGSLSVVLKDAKALENGKIGDRITLINPDTKERIVGKVIDASNVEVRF